MSHIKTAISIQESLFKEVDALARQMDVPRSRLFVIAVEEFLQRHQNQRLLEQLNQAYADGLDPAERHQLSRMKARQRKLVEGEW